MKTGYTEAAGHCLICSGSRPGRDVIVVVLGDRNALGKSNAHHKATRSRRMTK
jgi:D-alanyl-D-alanine carboxypeptidase